MKGMIRLIIFCSLAYNGWSRLTSLIHSPDLTVFIQADGNLSQETREVIKKYVYDFLKKSLPFDQLASRIKHDFSAIDDVTVTKNPDKKVILALSISKPLASCNTNLVLCANNALVPKEIFSTMSLDSLPSYHVSEHLLADVAKSDFCKGMMRACDRDMHERYNVAFLDKNTFHLNDKQRPHITLVLHKESFDQFKNKNTMQLAYESIASQLPDHGDKKQKNKKYAWHIDGRFENQMIVIPRGVVG